MDNSQMIDELIDLVSVEPVGEGVFRTGLPAWGDGPVFGGVILGKAVAAAVHNMPEGKALHSLHGYFLRPTFAAHPMELHVSSVREGRSFTTRRVAAMQDGKEVFSMTCSFHADDEGAEYHLPLDPEAPPPDETQQRHSFGPIEMREVGATAPGPDGTHRSTGRAWFRVMGRLPDDPKLHTSVLAHMSDMTRNSARPPSLGEVEHIRGLISLDHALWFHRPVRADEWLFFDLHSLVHAGGRGVIRGTMHTEDGKLALSMAQEMLIQPLEASERRGVRGE
jgi:acyl-CoA thioesterase II